MTSLILSVTTRFLLPLLLLYALFLLLRGHHAPGGGFSAGLVVGAAFGLYTIAFGARAVPHRVRRLPRLLLGVGLLTATASGTLALLRGQAFLVGQWAEIRLPLVGSLALGTPLLFDGGVFLVVTGTTIVILLTLLEEG